MTSTHTHPEQAGFIASIVAQPEGDTARLVYADWLDEHGQPERAEFIRVQCELTRRMEESARDAEPLLAREAALLEQHGREWSRWACPDCRLHERRYACTTCGNADSKTGNLFRNRDPQFRRGFVYRVTVPTSWELIRDENAVMSHTREPDWQPRPLLTALAQTTVEEVWVGDVVPPKQIATATHSLACKGQPAWEWWDSAVPKPLFDWMWKRYPDNRDQHPSYMRGNCLEFPSESEARSVLGRAFVAFGKKGVRR